MAPRLVTSVDPDRLHVSVTLVASSGTSGEYAFPMGNASADYLPRGLAEMPRPCWWLARCFVRPEYRRKGHGRALVEALQREIAKKRGGAPLIVSPGGYDLSPREQHAFYAACGFVPIDDERGVLQWLPSSSEAKGVRP